MKPLYIILVRPVGSKCWTPETISHNKTIAERRAADLRNKKIRFHDGSVHLQSTAIVKCQLPGPTDTTQQHYEDDAIATVKLSIP